jgi:hypothetical protein
MGRLRTIPTRQSLELDTIFTYNISAMMQWLKINCLFLQVASMASDLKKTEMRLAGKDQQNI